MAESMPFTVADLADRLSGHVLDKGAQCQIGGQVQDAQIRAHDAAGVVITGSVRQSQDRAHSVYVAVSLARPGAPTLDGDCSCEAGYNCEHVVAVLLEAERRFASGHDAARQVVSGDRRAGRASLRVQRRADPAPDALDASAAEKLLYVVEGSVAYDQGVAVSVRLVKGRALKRGGYAGTSPFSVRRALQARPAKAVTPADADILRRAGPSPKREPDGVGLSGETGARLLEDMIRTGRCHFDTEHSPALEPGDARMATVEWREDEFADQWLDLVTTPPSPLVMPVCPPWYIDFDLNQAGPLETALSPRVAAAVSTMSRVTPENSDSAALLADLDKHGLPHPRAIDIVDVHARPVPVLRLLASEREPADLEVTYPGDFEARVPCRARLTFEYAGHEVAPVEIFEDEDRPHVVRAGDGRLRLHRDEEAEEKALDELIDCGLEFRVRSLRDLSPECEIKPNFVELSMAQYVEPEEDLWIGFILEVVPALREDGWRVEIADDFDYGLIEPQAWHADLEPGEGDKWFALGLGLEVDGEVIPLLPILHNLLAGPSRRSAAEFARELEQTQTVVLPYRNKWLRLPGERVRAVVRTLVELFDPELQLDDRGSLRVSGLRASEVEALDGQVGGLRWQGGDNAELARLAQRVRAFDGVVALSAPQGFAAELRPYQESGLGWLQALRELRLGGILADDMGLGKTVQTLAHLLIEHQSGRQAAPSLVVAPTSVIANWAFEARRFTPSLRVMILHGAARHSRFDEMHEYDLVITTFALARRDHARLREQAFYYLVVDEAQAVKNPRSKARDALVDFRPEHRLCLTGTPLENHLGELWSLVDLVEPGLLGSERQFAAVFRRPIERDNDAERRKQLAARIAPLLLRRKKSAIDEELPDKIEMIQHIELQAAQRDLYETVRVAMDAKVRQALAQAGFERSRIVVLDALLKLRQTCCDPALVKLDAARGVEDSAKLERLGEMLDEMVAEGRRVLVFSQFTEMLALVERKLGAAKIDYVKLTGRTRDRVKPIEQFQSGAVPVFLISLKAGGTGLNLTAADTVIHYDPWWNPAVESQATDRAHRIGQDKTVFVYKLIATGTVESRMLELQARKRALAEGLLDDAGTSGGVGLLAEDIERLFEPMDVPGR